MHAFPTSPPVTVRAVDLVAADRAHLWHPFTQQRGWTEEPPLVVDRAEGSWLIDVEGKR